MVEPVAHNDLGGGSTPSTPTIPSGTGTNETYFKTLNLLKIESLNGPIYFVVEGIAHKDDDMEALRAHASYFYEEHTCPTNFMRGVELIQHQGDVDPHGVFEYVDTVWMMPEYVELAEGCLEWEYLHKVFPQLKAD